MNRTLRAVSLVSAAVLATSTVQAQGVPTGREPGTEPNNVHTPTTAPNWTPTAEGAIARQQIHDAGYNGVTILLRNKDGSWQGQALKGDTYYMIKVDPAGHVAQQ